MDVTGARRLPPSSPVETAGFMFFEAKITQQTVIEDHWGFKPSLQGCIIL